MKATRGTTIAQICSGLQVSVRLFHMVAKVHRLGCPEVFQQIRDGRMSAHLALQICICGDHDVQRQILAEMAGMRTREKTQFMHRVLLLARQRGEVA